MAIANTTKDMPKKIEYIPNACPILANLDKTNMCPFQKTCNPSFLVSMACIECCNKYADPALDDATYRRDWF